MPLGPSVKQHRCYIILVTFLITISLFLPFILALEISNEQKITPQIFQMNSGQSPESLDRAPAPEWPMFGRDSSHTHLAPSINKGIYQPFIKWDKWSQINGNGIDSKGCTIGNFSNNVNWQSGSYRNVNHVVYADNGNISILDGETGEFVWQLDVDLIDGLLDNDQVYTAVTLGYFNSNSDLDLIFGTADGYLYCYEPTTNYDKTSGYEWSSDNVNQDKLWGLSVNETFTRSSPVLGILDGDSYQDVIIGAGNKLFAISTNKKTELWQQTLPGAIVSTPVLYKDGSDTNALVTTLNQTNLNYSASFFDAKSSSGNRLDVFYYDISTFPLPTMIPSPAVAELDGKTGNDKELVVCTPFEGFTGNGRVYVYFANRTLFWSTPTNTITGQIEATPAVADLDGDGYNEIIIVSWSLGTIGPVTHIYTFHGNNGTLAWHLVKDTSGMPPFYINERAIGSPIIADVNTDKKLDVVFETSPNIYAIDGVNGTDLWATSLLGNARELWSTPAAGDIDNDGFLDIVAEGAAISHVIIDLTMSKSDFSLSSENITENQQVTIKVIVHNNGIANAEDVKVSFFENDELIGNSSSSLIPSGDSREVRMDWTPNDDGKRKIKVIIDPKNAIEEVNEKNNDFETVVNVIPTYPDFIVESVEYYRGDGKKVDNKNTHLIEEEEAIVRIFIKNIGGDEGFDLKVQLLDWGVQLGTTFEIPFLDIQEIKNITYTWKPSKGFHEIKVKTDPQNIIDEVNETNNEYVEQIKVNNKVPMDHKFICKGWVYQPDNTTPAKGIDVTFINNRTKMQKVAKTNSTGYYKLDLQTIEDQYNEGDEIVIHASDGENESTQSFLVYSEDKTRIVNITLIKLPTYAVAIKVDTSGKTVYPNEYVIYNLTIINRGNEYNTIELIISEIKKRTGEEATDWEAYLNDYMIENIPPKSSQTGIVLTVKAPTKNEQAKARDQVLVAITAKSMHDSDQIDIVGVTTTVGRVYDFVITIKNPRYDIDPFLNRTAKFEVNIENNGNDDDTINLDLTGQINWTMELEKSIDLELGEGKDIELSITGPETAPAGEVTFTFSVVSIDEKGYVSTQLTVNVIRPDLKFYQNVTANPKQPTLSKQVTFEVLIINDGSISIDSFFVEFRATGPDDYYDIIPIINLSSGKIKTLFFNWTPSRSGHYDLEFKIDPNDDIIEANKKNNVIKLEYDFTEDVAILNDPIFSDNNPKEDDKIQISVTVKNLGNVDIIKPFQVEFYDGNPDEGGDRIATWTVSKTFPAQSDVVVTIEWKVTGTGDKTIYVVANPNRNFTEENDDNNIVSKSIYISKKSSIEEFTDYSTWIVLLIFVIGILIILFLFFSPDKHPKYGRKKGRTKPKKGKPKSKARASIIEKKEVKFLEIDEEEVEVAEIEEYDEDEEEDEEELISKRKAGKKGKKSGIFGSLFAGLSGSGKKRAGPKKSGVERKAGSTDSGKLKKSTKGAKGVVVEEYSDSEGVEDEEEVAVVEVIGEGEAEEEDLDQEEEKTKEKRKIKGKGKGKSESDMGWEYSQMIGIR